jgi:hypothetical protein
VGQACAFSEGHEAIKWGSSATMATRVVAIVEKFRQVCQLKESVAEKLGVVNKGRSKLDVTPAYLIGKDELPNRKGVKALRAS